MGRRFVDVAWIAKRMQFKDDRINRALAKIAAKEVEMADRLALATLPSTAPAVTAEHLALVKATIAKDATPAELDLFLYDCARQGVHPLDKLIHFTKRSGKYTPVTSIDFLRIRAAESGECAGIDEPVFNGAPKAAAFMATVTVWRLVQGNRYAFTATARWSEYKPDQGFMWEKMPHTMLGKCAEALALRKGFPKQLAGLYVHEEMAQAGEGVTSPVTPPRASKSVPPSPGPAVLGAVIADPGSEGAPAAPAIPDAWVPFVKVTTITGRITGGTRNKTTGKTTLDIETGDTGVQQVWTLDKDLAKVATVYKDEHTPVTFTITPDRAIVTVAEATDAAF